MTQPLTENSPAVRLYAAEEAALNVLKNRCFGIDLCNPASMKSWAKQIVDAVAPSVLAERTAELEARVKMLEEALARINDASPGNTNSHTAASAFSWCKAVAATALENRDV